MSKISRKRPIRSKGALGTSISLALASLAVSSVALAQATAPATSAAPAAPAPQDTGQTVNSGASLAEVVVRARKRSERLFDIPIDASVASGTNLTESGIHSVPEMAEDIPSLNIGGHTAGGDGASITIRGIGTDGTAPGIAQSVLLDVDGVPISHGRALFGSDFDLQQVTVLKGPQSLYFGKNSPAGVIVLESRAPTDHFEASNSTYYGFNFGEIIEDAALSGPLEFAPGFSARLAVHADDMKGWMHNDAPAIATGGPAPYNLIPGAGIPRDGETEYAGRFTLQFDRGGPFTASLTSLFDHYEDDSEVADMELLYCSPGFPQTYHSILLDTVEHNPYANCGANWTTYSAELPASVADTLPHGWQGDGNTFTHLTQLIDSLRANYKLGDALTLSSVTGYFHLDTTHLTNNDWMTDPTIYSTEGEWISQLSEELRLASSFAGPLNFMVGGYVEHQAVRFNNAAMLDQLPADPVTGSYSSLDVVSEENDKTYSEFAELMYKFAPKLELDAGARYTHEPVNGFVGNIFVNPVLAGFYPVRLVPGGGTASNVSPEATLTWRPTDRLTVYGAYKTGYLSGGISLSQLVTAADNPGTVSFQKETAKGFEAGIKELLLSGRMSLQLTGYRYTYDGLQVSSWVPQADSYEVRNAAASRTYGADMDVYYHVLSGLTLRSSISFDHARYLSFANAPCYATQTVAEGCTPVGQDLTGHPTLTAPNWVANVGVNYSLPVASNYFIAFGADGDYSSGYYVTTTEDPHALQGSFVRLNANVRLAPNDSRWAVSLIGRNLTNRAVILSGQDEPLSGNNGNPYALLGVLAPPREVAVQVDYSFAP